MAIFPLESKRLLLREIVHADWRALHDTASERMLEDPLLYDPGKIPASQLYVEQALYEQKRVPRRRYELAIVDKHSRAVIGAGSLRLSHNVLHEADIGYIVHPKYWRQGFGHETAKLLMNYAFSELNIFRVTAVCEETNQASLRILKRLGMSPIHSINQKIQFARIRPISVWSS